MKERERERERRRERKRKAEERKREGRWSRCLEIEFEIERSGRVVAFVIATPASIIFIFHVGFNDRVRERSIHARTCEADAREVRTPFPPPPHSRASVVLSLWTRGSR